jgi:sulfite reductase alpha subunit-like flavoprotein
LANRRLTASDWEQDVRHIELDISESGMAYAWRIRLSCIVG